MLMSPHPAQAACRGSLSARQWQEARQWARLARSEGVEITWRGSNNITFKPLGSARVTEQQAPPVSRPKEVATPRSTAQPMDTGDAAVLSKKQQRDTTRRLEFRTKKRIACWQRLTSSILRRSRWQAGQDVWTKWMRDRMSGSVRRKLRSLFWREWTRPQFDGTPALSESADYPRQLGFEDVGLRSHRDVFILERARSRCNQLVCTIPWALCTRPLRYWLGGEWDPDGEGCMNKFDRKEHGMLLHQLSKLFGSGDPSALKVQALKQTPAEGRQDILVACDEGIMFSPRDRRLSKLRDLLCASLSGEAASDNGGSSANRRKEDTRSREEVDGPATPASARAPRKRRGRR